MICLYHPYAAAIPRGLCRQEAPEAFIRARITGIRGQPRQRALASRMPAEKII
jgi:hypothetical protein